MRRGHEEDAARIVYRMTAKPDTGIGISMRFEAGSVSSPAGSPMQLNRQAVRSFVSLARRTRKLSEEALKR